jgi:hypothetical protein
MPHNFHDTNGWLLVGVDQHGGLHWPVPLPVNMVPMNFWELNVANPFTLAPGGDRNPTVLINGVESVKWECSPKLLFPHVPFAPDPLNLLFPLDVIFGTHKCWLPKANVIAEGKPMTPVCIYGMVSINFDCFMWTKAPTSAILQPGTVETTPTAADYMHGALSAAIELAFDALFHFLTGGFKTKKPPPKGTVARANWRSLRKNLGDFFKGPRSRTLQRTALNRFRKEAISKIVPRKWNTKKQQWEWKKPAAVVNWGLGKAGVNKKFLEWNPEEGGVELKDKVSSLLPDAGEPFNPVEFGKSLGGNFFPPLKLL